jgi:hypothetical protein
MELEGYKWRAPTYRDVPIEPLMRRDRENGIQSRNLVCGHFFLGSFIGCSFRLLALQKCAGSASLFGSSPFISLSSSGVI